MSCSSSVPLIQVHPHDVRCVLFKYADHASNDTFEHTGHVFPPERTIVRFVNVEAWLTEDIDRATTPPELKGRAEAARVAGVSAAGAGASAGVVVILALDAKDACGVKSAGGACGVGHIQGTRPVFPSVARRSSAGRELEPLLLQRHCVPGGGAKHVSNATGSFDTSSSSGLEYLRETASI